MKKSFFDKTPFLIAEISANHCGKLNLAKKLIMEAKKNGANAVKLQTYKPDSLTLKSNKKYFKLKKGLWKGANLWDLYNQCQTPFEWHKELFRYSKKLGIKIFSSPFDEEAVDLLENLNCPAYKIASFEMQHIKLLKRVVKTNKPIIVSTGTFSLMEIKKIYNLLKKLKAKDITILYCVSNYPSNNKDFNLNNIKILKKELNCRIGLSDHSTDSIIGSLAVAVGAEVIEKHIALPNQKEGPDIAFSLKGKEIKKFKNELDKSFSLLGKSYFYRTTLEKENIINRRSIFVSKDIDKGQKFTKNNIKVIRPGHGISPIYFDKLINKVSPIKINKDEPLNQKILKKLKIL
jgi:pseudaminic acid synthase